MSYLSVRLTGITYTYNHLIELIDFGNDPNYLKQKISVQYFYVLFPDSLTSPKLRLS